jgi:membrane associated rhomboid family serine protease
MRWRDAPAVAGIALATLVVSTLILLSGGLSALSLGLGFIPARFAGELLPAGLPLALPAFATPLSATLVHGGVMHLLFNLVMLVFCGRLLERALGGGGIAILYVVGAYAAAVVQWAVEPVSAVPMIGASGAISAIVGAYALLYGERRTRRTGPIPADVVHVAWLAAAWIGLQLLIGAAGMGGVTVAIGAHIGGFVAGLALGRPLLLWRYRNA